MCPGTAVVGMRSHLVKGIVVHILLFEGKVNKLSREYGQRGDKNNYFNNI